MLIVIVLFTLCGATLSAAGARLGAVRGWVSAAEARHRGQTIAFSRRSELGEALVAVEMSGIGHQPTDPRQLLDVAPDGRLVAVADRLGPDASELILAGQEGDQLRVPTRGLLAAAFAPDGEWLAVLDGSGSLHRVSTADGTSIPIADGPFLGQPIVTPADHVLVLAVPSVEAPFRSSLVRVGAGGATSDPLTDDELVYGATLLGDGSLAVIAHLPSGVAVRRLAEGRETLLFLLDSGAIGVAVAPDGATIAWEVDGGIQLRRDAGEITSLGPGSRPRFAPSGRLLLLDRSGHPTLLDLAGEVAHDLDASGAEFVRCPAGCGS